MIVVLLNLGDQMSRCIEGNVTTQEAEQENRVDTLDEDVFVVVVPPRNEDVELTVASC